MLLFAGIGFYIGWLDNGPQKRDSLDTFIEE